VTSVAEAANRSSVVVHALDPQGLLTLRPDAAGSPRRSAAELDAERAGLSTLAEETGGLMLADTNDLSGPWSG
jgi:hypothetical protein